jgi:hypothetical protein
MSDDPEPEGGPVPSTGPRPLGNLADLAELLGGESQSSRRFLGGLVVGALVGAAIAGSTLLRGRHRRSSSPDEDAPLK